MLLFYVYRFLFHGTESTRSIQLCCFHLHEIRKYFNCPSCWSRFNVYFIHIFGKKLTPSSIRTPSIHQGPLLPISFLPGWMSTSPLWGCSLQWIFLSHLSVSSHDVSWIDPPSLSVMISGFISVSEDGLHSYFNPWFKIHSRPISHYPFLCPS